MWRLFGLPGGHTSRGPGRTRHLELALERLESLQELGAPGVLPGEALRQVLDREAERLDRAIRQGAGRYLVDLQLFDVYRGAGVADDSRSLAYRLRLQALDRSLTDQDIADVRRGVEAAAAKLGAELRG